MVDQAGQAVAVMVLLVVPEARGQRVKVMQAALAQAAQ
jgi:hypothetical protein